MKVLLDENLPHALRAAIDGHEVVTAAFAGWAGIRNGILLALAEDAGFQVLVTGDRNLSYQQNFADRRIALVVVTDQRWPILRKHLDGISTAIARAAAGTVQTVVCDEALPIPEDAC